MLHIMKICVHIVYVQKKASENKNVTGRREIAQKEILCVIDRYIYIFINVCICLYICSNRK